MKYFLCLALLVGIVPSVFSINNRIYLNAIYGVVYQPQEHSNQEYYFGANIGWHGVFENSRQDLWNSGFGAYNVGVLLEIGYYQYVAGESLGSLKGSAGISLGQYFVLYVKPNFFYHLNTSDLGLSSSVGLKINTFINDFALSFGIGSDIPIPVLGKGMYPFENSVGIQVTFDIIYDINRTKKKSLRQ
jgi:hypothetical protein